MNRRLIIEQADNGYSIELYGSDGLTKMHRVYESFSDEMASSIKLALDSPESIVKNAIEKAADENS